MRVSSYLNMFHQSVLSNFPFTMLVLTCLLLGIHCSEMYLIWSCGSHRTTIYLCMETCTDMHFCDVFDHKLPLSLPLPPSLSWSLFLPPSHPIHVSLPPSLPIHVGNTWLRCHRGIRSSWELYPHCTHFHLYLLPIWNRSHYSCSNSKSCNTHACSTYTYYLHYTALHGLCTQWLQLEDTWSICSKWS